MIASSEVFSYPKRQKTFMALARARSGSNSLGRAISAISSLQLDEFDRQVLDCIVWNHFTKARELHNRWKNPRHGRQNDLESGTTSRTLSWISLCHDCCSPEPSQIRPRCDRIPVRRSRWDQDSLS